MGLNTTHGCFDGAYSSFARFRKSLAHQTGISLDDYIGYGNENATKDLESIEHDLMPLFNHSDCDGRLTIKECRKIAKGMNSVLENFNDELPQDYDFKERIVKFRDGCLKAVSERRMVFFR